MAKKDEKGGIKIIVNGQEVEPEITEYKDGKPVKTTKYKKTDKPKEKKGKGGAKPKWDELNMPAKLEAVTGWAKQGYIDVEIAALLGISPALLYKWKNDYPEFKAALLKGKEIANGELVNAAFRNATGYYVQVTEPFKVKTMKNFGTPERPRWEEVEEIIDHTYMKYIPPNATMGIFMLKNRMPENYRDKQEIKHEGQMGVTFVDDIPGDDEA